MDVNLTLAGWSMLLIYSAGAVYALAFVVCAFDLFGGRKAEQPAQTVKRTQRTVRAARTEAALAVGGTASSATAVDTLEPEEAGPADRVSRPEAGDDSAQPRTSRAAARVGTALTVLGLILHIGAIVTRGLSVMRAPWGNMMEYALLASALAGVVYLIVLRVRDIRYLGTFVTGFLLVAIGLSTTVFYTPAAPLVPALRSYWILIHVPIAVLSTGLLTISAALAVFQLLQGVREKRLDAGRSTRRLAFLERMPAAASIERASYRLAAVGFITWTFTLIAGAIWAEVAWGRYWGWDAKEIWTFVVWVIYAAYLHSRATRGLQLATIARLNLTGFLAIIFNFTIVNMYFNGLHSYSGL